MNSSTIESDHATATNVRVDADALTVELTDGRVVSVPIGWYPRLSAGTAAERSNWRLIADGRGVHWPDLDEDVRIENLLNGKASGESQASLKKWLDERERG